MRAISIFLLIALSLSACKQNPKRAIAAQSDIDGILRGMVLEELNRTLKDSITIYMDANTMKGSGVPAEPFGPNPEWIEKVVATYVTSFVKAATYTSTSLKTFKPAVGTIVYNSTTKTFQKFNGTTWVSF